MVWSSVHTCCQGRGRQELDNHSLIAASTPVDCLHCQVTLLLGCWSGVGVPGLGFPLESAVPFKIRRGGIIVFPQLPAGVLENRSRVLRAGMT